MPFQQAYQRLEVILFIAYDHKNKIQEENLEEVEKLCGVIWRAFDTGFISAAHDAMGLMEEIDSLR